MPATTTGAPFSLNVPSLSSDLADLFGTYLVPNMTAINTNAAHKGTAQTFSALQTFSSGLNVSSGNVGIGTSSPSEKLHISNGNFAIDKSLYGGYLKWTQGTTSPRAGYWEWGDGTGWRMDFGPPATPRLSIYDNGNVGIGTASPAHPFHMVVGSSSYLCVDTSTAANTGFLIRDSGLNKWLMYHDSGTGRLYVVDSNLNDGVYMSQNTTSWTANSDSRLKDVQGTITDALAKVGQLTGVRFTWKRDADNPDAKVRVGLIAQDVQAVLPEAVDDESPDLITDEETGKISGGLGVRYTEVVPLLVNAIKELTARVVTLEAQIASA